MNEMNCYLNAHPGIHNVALLLNDKCGYTEIKDFCVTLRLPNLLWRHFGVMKKLKASKTNSKEIHI